MASIQSSVVSWALPYAPQPDSANVSNNYADVYKIKIHSSASNTIIVGAMPESFSLSLQANWPNSFDKPLQDLVKGANISKGFNQKADFGAIAAQIAGISTRAKWLSIATWESGSPLSIELPMVFKAFNNSVEDVTDQIVKLMSMVAPGTSDLGTFLPPGPTILGNFINGQTGGSHTLSGDIITVNLGLFMRLSPVIVKGVSSEVQSQFDAKGNPMSTTINVSIETPYVVTKEDLVGFFLNNSLRKSSADYRQDGGIQSLSTIASDLSGIANTAQQALNGAVNTLVNGTSPAIAAFGKSLLASL